MELARTQTVDSFLIHIDIAGTNGMDICRELRGTEPYKFTPVILYTRNGGHDLDRRRISVGMYGYSCRPFDEFRRAASQAERPHPAHGVLRTAGANAPHDDQLSVPPNIGSGLQRRGQGFCRLLKSGIWRSCSRTCVASRPCRKRWSRCAI